MVFAIALAISLGGWSFVAAHDDISDSATETDNLSSLELLPAVLKEISVPKIPLPQWYKDQVAAERAARAAAQTPVRRSGAVITVTYSIATKG